MTDLDLPALPPRSGGAAVRTTRSDASVRERFRPDLEGLRAVAVVLVLLFHAGVPGFSGGYVGVDVFFVLSGFLITGLIVRELTQTGTISLVAFYARRARRLLPVAALALAVTAIASAILLPPLRVPEIAGDAAAAALYSSNLRFAVQATDYLQAELDPSPLLHYWSLGVEEQFYLFWPALLLLAARAGRGTLGRIAIVVAGVGIGSLVLSLALTQVAEPWAFFSLPARAWELALGAMVALTGTRPISAPPRVAAAAGGLGLAMIVASGLLFDTGTPFPGTAALLPTLGAALVIAAGLRHSDAVHARLLSLPPMRWLGRISYSLYLWHWPIIVIPAAALGTALPLPVAVALAVVAIPVAAVSQRFVEEPIRRGRFVGLRPRRNLALAGVVTLVVATLSVGIAADGSSPGAPAVALGDQGIDQDLSRILSPPPLALAPMSGGAQVSGSSPSSTAPAIVPSTPPSASPPSASTVPATPPSATSPSAAPLPSTSPGPVPANLTPSLVAARDDVPLIYADGCHLAFAQTQPGPCVFGLPSSSTTVVLFGDSHAAQWFPAMERLSLSAGWRMVSLTKSACTPADVTVWNGSLKRAYNECDTWRANALQRIAAEHPALVVLSIDRGYVLANGGQPVPADDKPATWDGALGRTLSRLTSIAGHVVFIGDTPRSAVDPPICLSAHLGDALVCATPETEALDPGLLAAVRQVGGASGVEVIDPTPWVCPSEPCPAIIGRVLVYRDRHHLTATFSAALARYLGSELPPVLE